MHEIEQRAEFDLLMESQYWPAERIRDLQRERLEMLLRHAKAHVPFYARRLDVLFRQNGSIDWDRWGEVPIVRREDLLQHRRAMLARAVPPGHEQISDISTSGSTGKPATTSHSTLALALSSAAVYRSNNWHSLDHSARLGSWYGDNAKVGAWPQGRRSASWGPWWDERSRQGEFFQVNRHTGAPEVLEFFARNRVRYITGGGTDLRLLAYETQRMGINLPIEVALVRSSDITEPGRSLLARVWGARSVSLYSSKEAHRIAHPCPLTSQWHVNDEQILIEILNADSAPVGPGEAGRVVVTPFNSFAQPLVRYEQGDVAIRGKTCGCGRHLTVMASISGRVKHMFRLADGSRVVPWLSDAAVASLSGAMFQVAQTALDTVEVRYESGGSSPTEQFVRAEIAALFKGRVAVRFVPVRKFDVPPSGKHLEFVFELAE